MQRIISTLLVRIFCGVACFCVFNCQSHAADKFPAPTDLATLAMYGQAINPAVALVVAAYSIESERKWREATNEKLDKLLELSQTILEEVRALSPKMERIVKAEFLEHATREFQGHVKALILYLDARTINPQDVSIKSGIVNLQSQITGDAMVLLEFNESSYHSSLAAYSSLIAIQKILGWNEDQLNQTRTRFTNVFSKWLDPERDRSFPAMRKRLNEEILVLQSSAQLMLMGGSIQEIYSGSGLKDFTVGGMVAVSTFFEEFTKRGKLDWSPSSLTNHWDAFTCAKSISLNVDFYGKFTQFTSEFEKPGIVYVKGGVYAETVPDNIAVRIKWKLDQSAERFVALKKESVSSFVVQLEEKQKQVASIDAVMAGLRQAISVGQR